MKMGSPSSLLPPPNSIRVLRRFSKRLKKLKYIILFPIPPSVPSRLQLSTQVIEPRMKEGTNERSSSCVIDPIDVDDAMHRKLAVEKEKSKICYSVSLLYINVVANRTYIFVAKCKVSLLKVRNIYVGHQCFNFSNPISRHSFTHVNWLLKSC